MAGRPPALQIKISNPNLFLLSSLVRVYRFGDDPFHQFPQRGQRRRRVPTLDDGRGREALLGLHSALFGSERPSNLFETALILNTNTTLEGSMSCPF